MVVVMEVVMVVLLLHPILLETVVQVDQVVEHATKDTPEVLLHLIREILVV